MTVHSVIVAMTTTDPDSMGMMLLIALIALNYYYCMTDSKHTFVMDVAVIAAVPPDAVVVVAIVVTAIVRIRPSIVPIP
jgi:hypothetical protein